MAARSKAWIYGRSLAEVAVSNPAGGIEVPLSIVSVCYQVEVFATGRSLGQRSPTEFGVSECDKGTSQRRPWRTIDVEP